MPDSLLCVWRLNVVSLHGSMSLARRMFSQSMFGFHKTGVKFCRYFTISENFGECVLWGEFHVCIFEPIKKKYYSHFIGFDYETKISEFMALSYNRTD